MTLQHLEGEVISVVNKHGQEFVCSLPSVTPTDADNKSDENILDQLVDISGEKGIFYFYSCAYISCLHERDRWTNVQTSHACMNV